MIVSSGARAASVAEPEDLAPKAKVWASSEYNSDYAARFAVDGKVPEMECKSDAHQAWCIQRAQAGDHAEFTLQWEQPVAVAEIVYFGRTGQVLSECWKDYEVFLEDDKAPAAKGAFKMVHGPQRVPLAKRVVRNIRLRFLNSYGPYNPGASEICVYSARPSDAQLAGLMGNADSDSLRAALASGELGFKEVVAVQRYHLHPSHVYTYHAEGFRPGGGLYVCNVITHEARRLVDASAGIILNADLSWDGSEIVFAWKKKMGGRDGQPINERVEEHERAEPDRCFQIYRINTDGSQLTQLTSGPCNNLDPCWLPDGGIAFISDRKPAYAYCFVSTSPVLHRMDRDGNIVKRLSANYLMDFSPSVLHDGRILYTRWEYVDRGACPIQSLWAVKPDGTDLAGYFKNRMLCPGTFMQARAIPGSTRILALATNHNGDPRGGICMIDASRGANSRDAVTNVTPEVNIYAVAGVYGNGLSGPYETPFPVDGRFFLVSKNGALQLRTYDAQSLATLLRPHEGLGWFSALPLRPRERPPVLPANLPETPEGNWATVELTDVYHGLASYVERGEIAQIAVVQEIEKSTFTPLIHEVPFSKEYAANTAFGYQFPLVSCGATYAPKRVWGFADVAPDGSASFRVPTGVPIYFLALDRHGRAVQRMRTFTHFMPGEVQGCVGCHADRNYTTPSPALNARTLAAMLARPQKLRAPEWGVKGFSFVEVVQPVLDRHCVACHNAAGAPKSVDLSGDRTDFFNVAYDVLARKGTLGEKHPGVHNVGLNSRQEGRSPYTSWIATINGADHNIEMVAPKTWGSPASPLAALILNGHPDEKGRKRVDVPATDAAKVFLWIDLNVPYYPNSSADYPATMGCRRLMPQTLDAELQRVAKTRCAACHQKGVPRMFYTRISSPERNGFLLAPLAEAAGGTEKCGKPVFASKEDPDYQAILRTFEPVQEALRQKPRSDFPGGAQGCPACATEGVVSP